MEQKKWKYIIGDEIGDKGTPHLQIYIECKNPVSFNTIKKISPRAHIEKARGDRKQNIKYCSKEKVKSTNIEDRKLRLLKKYQEVTWKDWQLEIINLLENEADDRTINWYWEKNGNVGKSFLCKYLVLKYDAIIAAGKKNDVFNQIKCWMDLNPEKDPKIILLDIPRYNSEYVNYGSLEEIKNGMIYSGKYEGGICIFESPHVIVFSNQEPDYSKFSSDRFKVKEII